jgi:hypothetical protein
LALLTGLLLLVGHAALLAALALFVALRFAVTVLLVHGGLL